MARLPKPGSDDGTWGNILNDYLGVEHNTDGTHKSSVNPDATTTSKGKVKLAGDLAGTADAPTVPGLAAKADDTAVVHNTGDEPVAGIKTFSSSPVVPDNSFSQSKVTNLTTDLAAKADDADVVHIAGSETITGNKNFTGTLQHSGNAVVDTTDSRLSDTRTPTDGTVTDNKITAGGLSPSKITGTAVVTSDSRLSDARTPTGSAGGVLSGTYPNPTFASDLATQTELDAETAARKLPHLPIVVTRTAGDLALPTSGSFVWADVDTGGTASARPLDIVFPADRGVTVGDWVRVNPTLASTSTNGHVYLDMFVIVAGAVVGSPAHQFGNDNSGSHGWVQVAATYAKAVGELSYQVQTGDLEADGSLRLRLRARNINTTARSLLAQTNFPLRLEGRGPFH